MKNITICADDYAQNESISEGILTLLDKQRINAVGCIVNFPFWRECSQLLIQKKSAHLIGLHFNLTFGQPLSAKWRQHEGTQFLRLPALLVKSHFKGLSRACVERELEAQLDLFTETMSMPPDFIDGHQHIHQLPIIRDALFSVYAKRGLTCFIRHTSNGWQNLVSTRQFPKSQLIDLLGGLVFKKQLAQRSIGSNTSFSGVYNFKQAPSYADFFKQFLKDTTEGGLIMCHPGMPSQDKADPQYKARHHEFNYFMSDDFLHDLADNSCQLSSFKQFF